jgi:predicted nucleic acid-binding protein
VNTDKKYDILEMVMQMKKKLIYLDTSVINFYFAEDAPEKMPITQDFFDNTITNKDKYEVCLSPLVLEELGKTSDTAHRARLLSLAYGLQAQVFALTPEINRIAKQFIDDGFIPMKYKEDALHLAFSIFYGVDYIVSWNFKHIVKPKTKDAVRIVSIREGMKEVKILTPEEVVADESEV